MPKVDNFDVLRAMSEADGDIHLAPLSNILRIQTVKAGVQVTIGVDGRAGAGRFQIRLDSPYPGKRSIRNVTRAALSGLEKSGDS